MSHVNHVDFRREIDWTVMVCNFHYMLQQFQISRENPVGFSIFGILWMMWRCDWIRILWRSLGYLPMDVSNSPANCYYNAGVMCCITLGTFVYWWLDTHGYFDAAPCTSRIQSLSVGLWMLLRRAKRKVCISNMQKNSNVHIRRCNLLILPKQINRWPSW